jgi:hypothetical protein
VTQLYPQALGFLFVASYDSQGYGGGIRTHLHAGLISNCQSQSQSQIATDGQSVSKSWCRAPSAVHDQIFITLWQLRSCFCGAPSLTRGRVCLSYMMLVVASVVLLGSESLGTRYCLLLSQIWDFHFRRLLRLAGSRWRDSNPEKLVCVISPQHWRHRKYLFHYCVFPRCRRNDLSTELLPSNGCRSVACWHSCYLAMGLHITVGIHMQCCALSQCRRPQSEHSLPWKAENLQLKLINMFIIMTTNKEGELFILLRCQDLNYSISAIHIEQKVFWRLSWSNCGNFLIFPWRNWRKPLIVFGTCLV